MQGEKAMTTEVSIHDKQVKVTLSGSIYVQDTAAILEKLLGFIDRGQTSFLIDLSAVDYMDSAGLGTLLAIHNRARKKGGGVSVKGLHGLVKELFTHARVDKVFAIV